VAVTHITPANSHWNRRRPVSDSLSYSTMNVKVERLRESRTYRRLLQNRRCVIPVDGFYEFAGEKGSKILWFVYLKSKEPFSLAGLWDTWKKPDGGILDSFSLITLPPNDFMRPIHDRIPAFCTRTMKRHDSIVRATLLKRPNIFSCRFPPMNWRRMWLQRGSTIPGNNEPDCGAPGYCSVTVYSWIQSYTICGSAESVHNDSGLYAHASLLLTQPNMVCCRSLPLSRPTLHLWRRGAVRVRSPEGGWRAAGACVSWMKVSRNRFSSCSLAPASFLIFSACSLVMTRAARARIKQCSSAMS